jgi:twitching motility protein PilU
MGEYGRFRVNVFKQRQMPGLVIRRIISKIPTLEELRLPPVLASLAGERRGLVLVTGMTGSGKSTTLASMLNYRNEREEGHILTIEDPIEYYHDHKKSVVTQREVGVDTESYNIALKNALRQRPDVILIGEIRDKTVMEQALTIAETGHLCLATLHTNNAYQAIERIVNFFPEEFHNQTRLNLSMNLKAIISQRLIPSLKGGLVPALEILVNQALIREQIQKGDYEKIPEVMEQNTSIGMCTFDQSLLSLYSQGYISEETAVAQSDKSSDMGVKIRQLKLGKGSGGLRELDTSNLRMSDAY